MREIGVFKIEVSPGYLHGVRNIAKEAISVLCQKDSLTYEEAKAIRLMSEVLGCLDVNTILRFQKEKIRPFSEDYSRNGIVPNQPHG